MAGVRGFVVRGVCGKWVRTSVCQMTSIRRVTISITSKLACGLSQVERHAFASCAMGELFVDFMRD